LPTPAHVVGYRSGTGARGRPAPRHAAASLVEILVSISVLMAAMGILAQYLVMGLDESSRAHRRAAAYLFAQERLEEILAHRSDLESYLLQAEKRFPRDAEEVAALHQFDPPRENYRWRWAVNPVEGRPRLREVLVRVYWYEPQGPPFREYAELRTYVAVPGGPISSPRRVASSKGAER